MTQKREVILDTSVLINFATVGRLELLGAPVLLSTEELVVSLIQESILTIEEADEMKLDWETNHRFRLMFGSFREKI